MIKVPTIIPECEKENLVTNGKIQSGFFLIAIKKSKTSCYIEKKNIVAISENISWKNAEKIVDEIRKSIQNNQVTCIDKIYQIVKTEKFGNWMWHENQKMIIVEKPKIEIPKKEITMEWEKLITLSKSNQ